jgi:hypothetical protein
VATWTEAKQFIFQNYKVQSDDGSTMVLLVEGGGRSQLVFTINVNNFVFFTSPFAKVGDIAPGKALTSSQIFGVLEFAEMYALRHVALLDTLDVDELLFAVNELAGAADRLEQELVGGDNL